MINHIGGKQQCLLEDSPEMEDEDFYNPLQIV
jgi:hypothetical protein